jgi:hypothetical protein
MFWQPRLQRATVSLRPKFRRALIHNTVRPEHFRGFTSFRRAPAGLKCRCNYLQVLSRRLALAGSRQNALAEPSSIWLHACVNRCGFIRSNTLQGRSQRVLVLSGCLHCQSANPDNGCCYQRCCDDTYGGFNFDGFHKTALPAS